MCCSFILLSLYGSSNYIHIQAPTFERRENEKFLRPNENSNYRFKTEQFPCWNAKKKQFTHNECAAHKSINRQKLSSLNNGWKSKINWISFP